jgi:hypothetical protein
MYDISLSQVHKLHNANGKISKNDEMEKEYK